MANTSRRFQLMVLICQAIGLTNMNSIPTISASYGPIGSIIALFIIYVFLGVPLMYMEQIIGQFTGRDCLDVWRIRPYYKYTGYMLLLWQFIILIYNHTFLAFIVHYFLISFENPIPYYNCGSWKTKSCNILINNFTINEDCIKKRRQAGYCEALHTSFPEFQYWRYNVLGLGVDKAYHVYIAWRVCLASGIVSLILYMSCFKRRTSVKWVVSYLPIYPMVGMMTLIMGSMLQKGLVINFADAMDIEFSDFVKKFQLSKAIQQVVYNLGVGSGLSFNIASSTPFRSNCFSNSVIAVILSAIFSILVTVNVAMMTCPYAAKYGFLSDSVLKTQMTLVFEKIPRLLSEFDNKLFYIILVYSCYVTTGLCNHVVLFYYMLEIVLMRNPKVAEYPGLTCLVAVILLFLLSIPLLSNIGIIVALSFRRYVISMSIFVTMIECFIFVVCYGVNKFSEDVHFMLGIQPSVYMKAAWLMAPAFLGYAFFGEIIGYIYKYCDNMLTMVDELGAYVLMSMVGTVILCCVGKLAVAACKNKFLETIRLDHSWGPKSDVLQRSRAMFSAQAMTKEYMYRQYHLQAGIVSRQRNSNKRNLSELVQQQY